MTAIKQYDVITITKHTLAIPVIKKIGTRTKPRMRVADAIAEQQIDTAAIATSAFFALPVLRVNLCGLATAMHRSVARNASRHVENMTDVLSTYKLLALFPIVKHTQIVVSAMANAKMYALIDVVILRMYTATTNRFPGMPRMHIRRTIRLYVESGKVNVDSLATFLSEFENVCSEMDRL